MYRGIDKVAPEQIGEIKAEPTDKGIQLTWDPAQDNVAVLSYSVSRDNGNGAFKKIAETYHPQYLDTTAEKGKKYC